MRCKLRPELAAEAQQTAWSKMQAKVKSVYFNHPSQGNSANYYIILGPRNKAAPSTSQQISKFPLKQVKNLAIPSSFFSLFSFFIHRRALRSHPIRGKVRRIFPEHAERSFLDREYSFVAVRRITRTIFAKQKFAQLRTSYIHQILPSDLVQTCLVYAVGIEHFTFEAQTTHLHLHYKTMQMTLFQLRDSNKHDSVLFFDAILFLTRPPCSKGMWARLWYMRINSCNSDAGFAQT